jgi:putative zinc finger/helix-turn-helix YgiT family protein
MAGFVSCGQAGRRRLRKYVAFGHHGKEEDVMEKEAMKCPKGHRAMEVVNKERQETFRGVDIGYSVKMFQCPVCSLEAGTIDQTAAIQKTMADAYRKEVDLLTSGEIQKGRAKLGLSQHGLADRMKVGVASIKRWEGAIIQSKSMDTMLRHAFAGKICGDPFTGNRPFSIPRIKRALQQLGHELGRKILKKGEKMLYAAKYAWYTDMVSFRETGQSITGATYAALPFGPQINNYRDLIDEIMSADEGTAEPLTDEEQRIIRRVASVFPKDKQVFDAAHRETVWKEKPTGAMIPYTDADRLTEI